jgi:hypothetical protein
MVELEADIVIQRLQRHLVADAVLNRLAISSIPNQSVKTESTKSAAMRFDEIIKRTM